MRVDEVKIKKLIREYLKSKSKDVLFEIVKELSIMVYNYPKIVFRRNEDDCSEFYLYFIEKIENLITKYNENMASFNTWFNVVLKRRYLNWLNKMSAMKKRAPDTVLWDDISCDSFILQERMFYNIFLSNQNLLREDELKKRLNEVYKKLDVKDYLLIKLLYYPVDIDTLHALKNFLNLPLKECYQIYIQAYNENNTIAKQERCKEAINNIALKLSKIEEKMIKEPAELDKYNKQKNRLKNLLKKREAEYYKNLKVLDIKGVQKILRLYKSEIYLRLKNIKSFLMQELSDFVR